MCKIIFIPLTTPWSIVRRTSVPTTSGNKEGLHWLIPLLLHILARTFVAMITLQSVKILWQSSNISSEIVSSFVPIPAICCKISSLDDDSGISMPSWRSIWRPCSIDCITFVYANCDMVMKVVSSISCGCRAYFATSRQRIFKDDRSLITRAHLAAWL